MFDNTKPNIIILSDQTDKASLMKTVGPYKVATELRNSGFEVAVIHHLSMFSVTELKHILKNLISENTLFVGINNFFYLNIDKKTKNLNRCNPQSFLPHGVEYNQEIKQVIKEANHKCKLVLGGPNASDQPQCKDFDYVVVGYADNSIVNLAKHLNNNSTELLKSYKSIYGPTIVNDSKAEGYNFVESKVVYQDHDVILPGESLVLEISRGCIFKCSFCSYPLNGKKKLDFIRSRDYLRDELIDNYQRFGVTCYHFSDDTVNDSPEKCQMIYEVSKSLPFKLEWWGYLRLDLLKAHPQTVDWLFDSGLRAAYFGIETLNSKTATTIGKGGSRDSLFSLVKQIKEKYGNEISLNGSFIFGLPYEDLDSLKRTADFLLSDNNPLDTWEVQPLYIRPSDKKYSNDFLSDIEKNYSKYGYEDLGEFKPDTIIGLTKHPTGHMAWRNQHTDFYTVFDLANEVHQKKYSYNKNVLSGRIGTMIAGLGIPLNSLLNKDFKEIDWQLIARKKYQRGQLYKTKLCSLLKLPELPSVTDEIIETFDQWLQHVHK